MVRFECLRTIDRARIRLGLDDETIALSREAVVEQLETFERISLDPPVLGSLAALRLASALLVRSELPDLRFATHDRELGIAARAMGFDALG